MSKIYMAVTVCQDRNESIFKPRENAEYSPGYYSYVLPCKAGATSNSRLTASVACVLPTFAAQRKRRRSLWKPGTLDIKQTGNICLIPRRFEGVQQ